MKVIIHRGTHQIGGCITEIQSKKGTKIIIDIGENLPTIGGEIKPELKIDGLNCGEEAKYKAVLVTHYHGDHIGLYREVLKDIPIYIGKESKQIYKILQNRLLKAEIVTKKDVELIENFKTFTKGRKLYFEDITVTPFEVDHSAFNAHMFLIECDGKRVLHTGDFRLHGQRGKAVIPMLETYVGKVDCLICEGTTLSRKEQKSMTEYELQLEFEKMIENKKYTFVMCSSTNIDRIAGLHSGTSRKRKMFVCDGYQKDILKYIGSISRSTLYDFKYNVWSYNTNILDRMKEKGFVMLVRDNWISKEVMKNFKGEDTQFIYSQWEGYLDEKFTEYEHMQKFVPKDYIPLHTSGHADFEAIKKVAKTVNPNMLIPIHGENSEMFEKMKLENCEIKISLDGNEIEI